MKEINLRDFYPWYMEDVMVEVTEEVAEELLAGQRYIKASRRRVYRNKAHFSLDAEDGIEYSACFSNPSPQELIERMERLKHICHALNSLPDAQGQCGKCWQSTNYAKEASMVQSVTYQSETKTVHFQGKSIVLESLTPVLSPKEKEKRKKEIERCLYEVFSKYRKASDTPA